MSVTKENHSLKSHMGGGITLALNWEQFQLENV